MNYHWEKEYVLQAYEVGEIPVTICQRLKNTDTLFKINTLNLIIKNIPEPYIDSLKSFQGILKCKELTSIYDSDFKEGRYIFRINNYTFSAFNKRGKLIFNQECYGAEITEEIKKCIQDTETSSVRFENIRSKNFVFNNFEIVK